jgi:osmotically-inducible protein OsmY
VRIKPFSFLLGAAVGAAAEYFLDPQGGNRRRHVATDKAGKYAHQSTETVSTKAEQAANRARGAVVETAKSAGIRHDKSAGQLNDAGLAKKVESEIFRPADAPKDKVDVNVEEGVVYLRGQVEDGESIRTLVEAAGKVDGVKGVKNLLHRPGTSAPAKS